MICMRVAKFLRVGCAALTLAALAACAANVGAHVEPDPAKTGAPGHVAKAHADLGASAAPVDGAGAIRTGGPTHVDGAPMLYFTFDDGPDPGSTDLVLDELGKTHTPATFFILGQFTQTAAEQALVAREVAEGFSVTAHGFTHPDMKKWAEPHVLAEIRRIRERIVTLTGARPTCFRPPYGSYTPAVLTAAGKENLVVQLWDIDTLDWKHPDADYIYATIMKQLKPGAAILMHDGRGHGKVSAEVVRRVVAAATQQGYRFGSMCPLAKSS